MSNNENWIKEFDKKFCRIDKSPDKRGVMENWFMREYITGKEMKLFIRNLLSQEKDKLIEMNIVYPQITS